MQPSPENRISHAEFDAQALVDSYPPEFHHPNKRTVYGYVCPPGCSHRGRLRFSRWKAMALPDVIRPGDFRTTLEITDGFYGYEPVPADGSRVDWYVNFSHHDLFCSYGLGVFAQDEIQVAEHPALASLREALVQSGMKPLTVERGTPKPILVMGVERRCSVATDSNEGAGRPRGLYGRQFGSADPETILRATSLLNPPTTTNLVAMEAPSYGKGVYTEDQVRYILTAAFTGFSAARWESAGGEEPEPEVVIHTGFWGCGAYGGNRTLMAMLQILAARWSGVDRLVFHAGDPPGRAVVKAAVQRLDTLLGAGKPRGLQALTRFRKLFGNAPTSLPAVSTSRLISAIEAERFQWGESDRN